MSGIFSDETCCVYLYIQEGKEREIFDIRNGNTVVIEDTYLTAHQEETSVAPPHGRLDVVVGSVCSDDFLGSTKVKVSQLKSLINIRSVIAAELKIVTSQSWAFTLSKSFCIVIIL